MTTQQDFGLEDLFGSTFVGAGTEASMGAQLAIFRGEVESGGPKAESGEPNNPPIDDALLDRLAASKGWASRTKAEYRTTFSKLAEWWISTHRSTRPMRFGDLDRQTLAEFLDWRFANAGGKNAGRTHNKSVEQLSCLLRWGMHEDRSFIDALPRLPDEKDQRDDAGICFFTEDEINRIYWATYRIKSPRGWPTSVPLGAYLRCALVFFYNLGLDTQSLFAYDRDARERAIKRADIFLDARQPPSRQMPLESEHGWIWWTRNKTQKEFERPLNREMAGHVAVILGDDPDRDTLLMSTHGMLAGTHRPNQLFHRLCKLAKIEPKIDRLTREPRQWNLKDLRKTCGAYQEAADYSPAADMLGHSDSKVTYGHYVSGNIRASRALLRQHQPAAFRSIWDDTIVPPGQLFAK